MDTTTQVQIQDKSICISYSINTLGKGMNLIILPESILGQTGFFNLGMAISMEKKKLWFQTCLTPLKIDLVSHLVCEEGLGKDTYPQILHLRWVFC